jgi:hypothetical protein
LQANYLFIFKCNRAELTVLSEQFCPPDMKKQEFFDMVQDATQDDPEAGQKNNFMVIVKRAPLEQRFRRNLDEFIVLEKYEDPEIDVKGLKKHIRENKKQSSSDEDRPLGAKHDQPVYDMQVKQKTNVLPHAVGHSGGRVAVFDRATNLRMGNMGLKGLGLV